MPLQLLTVPSPSHHPVVCVLSIDLAGRTGRLDACLNQEERTSNQGTDHTRRGSSAHVAHWERVGRGVRGSENLLQRLEQPQSRSVHKDLVRDTGPESTLNAAYPLGGVAHMSDWTYTLLGFSMPRMCGLLAHVAGKGQLVWVFRPARSAPSRRPAARGGCRPLRCTGWPRWLCESTTIR
jgi:hypothetical protein